MELYLHIGTNKTGTSAIQRYLNNNRYDLIAKGVLYPQAGCLGEAHYDLSKSLGFSPKRFLDMDRNKCLSEIKNKVLEEIDNTKPGCIVFSSEMFIHHGAVSEVYEYFKEFDVRIVVYLRRHDKWWPSVYNQAVRHVKNPKWGVGFSNFIKFNKDRNPLYGNYRDLVDRWSAVFGTEKMLVRPYESEQIKPNIVSDFFSTIGRGDLAPQDVSRVNESIDSWSLRMIDIAQRAELDDSVRSTIIEYTLAHQRGGETPQIHPSLLLELVKQNMDDYQYIATKYLGRVDGNLYYEALPDEHAPPALAREPTPREVMSWTVDAIMGYKR